MSFTRFASSVALTCAALAVALPGCSSDQPEPGVGNLDMAVTLATPPAGPNEQIDAVEVSFWCEGVDPVLGVPRPPANAPEVFSINTSTSQGPEPKNTIGLFEKQGIPAGNCEFTFSAVSNTGNTECNGEITVAVVTNMTSSFEVVLACIHTPRYGGVRADGTFNQCAEYRQVLVSPTTQSVGNLVDVRTEVYDPDGEVDPVTVEVTTSGVCGNVATVGSDTAASCETVSGCEAVVNTVECTDVGPCEITVRVSDDGFDSCNGFLPDGSNNDAARRTIAVDCTIPSGCGNEIVEPGEDCEPPNTAFCDANCQDIFVCPPEADDPCDQSNECTPQTCAPDANNQPVCTDDPQTGGTCDLPGGESGSCQDGFCVACVNDIDCNDDNVCTDDTCNAGTCANEPNANDCTVDGGFPGTCSAGECVGRCGPDTCPDNGIECQTDVCDPEDGSCNTQNDDINTGCDLGTGLGVCDGAGACVECNIDAQCGAGETCVNNVCEGAGIACEYEQDFEALALTPSQSLVDDGWVGFVNLFSPDGQSYLGGYVKAPGTENGGLAAIEEGQGGAEQGLKQLVIISDYNNNAAQTAGERVEANTFQERLIVQDDVGKTIALSFDAKRGNIGGASTANAFIKTFRDPGNLIDFLQVDTTAIPDTWQPYSIEVVITGDLVGATLQFGFSATASNFEPSQVFYDNVTFGTPGCSGGGNGGGECVGPALPNLTINGDFETGDTCGWEFFPNDGTFDATQTQSNGGAWSGNLVASVPAGGGPPSFPLIKNANIGIGTVQPNSSCDISFDLFGSRSGDGGVFFAEFFSELGPPDGGTSSSVILGGGPLFPSDTWTTYTYNTPTGNDVSGGVTLQLKADCGANPGCTVDAYIDNVSVICP